MVMPRKTAADYRHAGQKAAATLRKEKKAPVLTDKQKALVEAMAFEGLDRKQAAEAAGITDETARISLLKPHVLAHLNECMEVLRTSARPRALRKMSDLLEAKTERIQFEAAKYLDGMDRPSHAVGAAQVNVQINNSVTVETPGYVIDLRPDHFEQVEQIEHLDAEDVIPLDGLGNSADVPLDE
jgi:hypothetical protein